MNRSTPRDDAALRLLIVDDSPEDRAVMRRYLGQTDRDFRVQELPTASSLLLRMRDRGQAVPDCILLDYHLPDSDAPALLAELGVPHGLCCPVIVLTGDRSGECGRAVLKAGAHDFIGKDWMNAGSLARSIENAIERFALIRERAEQEARFSKFIEASSDAIGLLGEQGFLECNPATLRIFGCASREEFVGKDPAQFSPPYQPDGRASSELARGHIAAALRKGTHRFEWQHRRLDGTPFAADVVLTSVQIDGQVALQACLRDISAQKDTEAKIRRLNAELASRVVERSNELEATSDALRESQRRLHQSVERLGWAQRGARAGVWEWDLRTDAFHWTPELAVLWGYRGGALSGTVEEFALRVHPEDRACITRVRDEALGGHKSFDLDFRIMRPSGEARWLNCQGQVDNDESGRPVRLFGMQFDITERKSIEEAFRSSEQRLSLAQQAGGIAIWDWDLETGRAAVSESYYALYGLPPGTSLTYADFLARVHPDDRARIDESFQSTLVNGTDYDQEMRIIRADDGEELWVAGKGRVEIDADGRPRRAMGVVQDITQRKCAELALMESEQRFRVVADTAPVMLWMSDTSRRGTFFNVGWLQFTGQTLERALGDGWSRAIHPDDVHRCLDAVVSAFHARQPFEIEYRLRRADGEYRWVLDRGRPRWEPPNRFVGYIGSCTDITNRVELEEALREADRRKDEFLATLAHELRNPLAAIRSVIAVFQSNLFQASDAARFHAILERQTDHLAHLVDDLLEISRIARGLIELDRGMHDLCVLVNQAVEMNQAVIERKRHTLTLHQVPGPLWVDGDPVRLVQVIANLVNNAAKYMADGGHIDVSVEQLPCEAVVRVRDEGIGIAAEELPRLFQLFHRVDGAAPPTEGSLGIGLYLVRQILELHSGRVDAQSEGFGCGSTFSVHLPLAAAPEVLVPATSDDAPKSGQRILLVDDNRDVADSLAFLLRGMGAVVEEAYDGETALGKLTGFRPDVILLDLGMSGVSGFDVARRVREMPAMQGVVLVAITGWGQKEDRRRTREAGFDHHLVKPTVFSDLWNLLETLPGNRDTGRTSARI